MVDFALSLAIVTIMMECSIGLLDESKIENYPDKVKLKRDNN